MLEIIDSEKSCIYESEISTEYSVKLDKLKEGQKITLASDIMFSTMFCNESRIKYSAKLLSYFLKDLSYEKILHNMKMVNQELDKKYVFEKATRADYVASIDGDYVMIEMNNNHNFYIIDRNIGYLDRVYARGVERGTDIKKDTYNYCIQLNLNNFSFVGNDKTYDIFYLQNEEGKLLTNKKIFIQIYIPNVMKKCYNGDKLTDLEKYLYTLFEKDIDKSLVVGEDDIVMKDYVNEAVEASGKEEVVDYYVKEWELWDGGLTEGRRKGYEQGIKEGIEKGKNESKKETAIAFLKKGVEIETVSECTGLPLDEVKKLLSDYSP